MLCFLMLLLSCSANPSERSKKVRGVLGAHPPSPQIAAQGFFWNLHVYIKETNENKNY